MSSFTRGSFLDALRELEAIIEASLDSKDEAPPSLTGGPENHPVAPYCLCVCIFDWEAKTEWWKTHMDSFFPTWKRQRRRFANFCTRELLRTFIPPC